MSATSGLSMPVLYYDAGPQPFAPKLLNVAAQLVGGGTCRCQQSPESGTGSASQFFPQYAGICEDLPSKRSCYERYGVCAREQSALPYKAGSESKLDPECMMLCRPQTLPGSGDCSRGRLEARSFQSPSESTAGGSDAGFPGRLA